MSSTTNEPIDASVIRRTATTGVGQEPSDSMTDLSMTKHGFKLLEMHKYVLDRELQSYLQ